MTAALLERIEDIVELKLVRHVRTPAGVRRYKQPIGSIIVGGGVLKNISTETPVHAGWTLVSTDDGQEYDIGQPNGPNGGWVVYRAESTKPLHTGTSEEEVLKWLDKHVDKPSKPKPKPKPGKMVAAKKPTPKKKTTADASLPPVGFSKYHEDYAKTLTPTMRLEFYSLANEKQRQLYISHFESGLATHDEAMEIAKGKQPPYKAVMKKPNAPVPSQAKPKPKGKKKPLPKKKAFKKTYKKAPKYYPGKKPPWAKKKTYGPPKKKPAQKLPPPKPVKPSRFRGVEKPTRGADPDISAEDREALTRAERIFKNSKGAPKVKEENGAAIGKRMASKITNDDMARVFTNWDNYEDTLDDWRETAEAVVEAERELADAKEVGNDWEIENAEDGLEYSMADWQAKLDAQRPPWMRRTSKKVPKSGRTMSAPDYLAMIDGGDQKKIDAFHEREMRQALEDQASHPIPGADEMSMKELVANVYAQGYIDQWAGDSGDHDPIACALQYRFMDRFGTTDAVTKHLSPRSGKDKRRFDYYTNDDDPDQIIAKTGGLMDAYFDAVYEETQERFKKEGIDEVVLYRGMNSGRDFNQTAKLDSSELDKIGVPETAKAFNKAQDDYIADLNRASYYQSYVQKEKRRKKAENALVKRLMAMGYSESYARRLVSLNKFNQYGGYGGTNKFGTAKGRQFNLPSVSDDVDLTAQPLSSWSSSYSTARGFGDVTFSQRVPVANIWSTAVTGAGCLNEHEYVVIGGKGKARIVG